MRREIFVGFDADLTAVSIGICISELKIREGIEGNSKIIFHNSQ